MNIKGGEADTLKFNLHISDARRKKGCEFNQKRCEFKILHTYIYTHIHILYVCMLMHGCRSPIVGNI